MQPLESDWKTFQAIVPALRERYLSQKNEELIAIFRGESLTPTDQFWTAYERMVEIREILQSCLDDHKRSNMVISLMKMYQHQMIVDADLVDFSEELRARISVW